MKVNKIVACILLFLCIVGGGSDIIVGQFTHRHDSVEDYNFYGPNVTIDMLTGGRDHEVLYNYYDWGWNGLVLSLPDSHSNGYEKG